MISIALATYNGEKYLKEQIDSILNQTYKDIEIVICDDCSKDGTRTILSELSKTDSRIKVYLNEHNLGFKKNFEKAISLCNGEFTALSDQDDIWESWKLEKSLKALDGYDIVCTNSKIIDDDGNDAGYTMKDSVGYKFIPKDKDLLFKHLLHANFVQGSTLLSRTDFLKSCLPIPDDFEYHDWWFAFNALQKNGINYLEDCSIRYRQHQSQVTTNKDNKFSEEIGNSFKTRDAKWFSDFYKNNLKKINFGKTVLKNSERLSLSENQKKYIESTIKYFEHMQNKDFYTFRYYVKNYEAIFLDKNLAKRIFRISKRLLGLFRWKITSAKKVAIMLKELGKNGQNK